jgi:transposase
MWAVKFANFTEPAGNPFSRERLTCGEQLREIVEEAGGELWYLPAYSPDLNKIENWWSVLKTWMKQMLPEFETVRECVDAAFKNCPNVFA